MSMLKSLIVDMKVAWVDYPGLDGFSVEVANLGRERLINIRKSCMVTKFDRKTKQPYDEVDDKKFVRQFTKETIRNWKGLKAKHLEELMLVDISKIDPETDIPYTDEDAVELVTNSQDFDTWLNSVVFDLENFRTNTAGGDMDVTREVSE